MRQRWIPSVQLKRFIIEERKKMLFSGLILCLQIIHVVSCSFFYTIHTIHIKLRLQLSSSFQSAMNETISEMNGDILTESKIIEENNYSDIAFDDLVKSGQNSRSNGRNSVLPTKFVRRTQSTVHYRTKSYDTTELLNKFKPRKQKIRTAYKYFAKVSFCKWTIYISVWYYK